MIENTRKLKKSTHNGRTHLSLGFFDDLERNWTFCCNERGAHKLNRKA